MSGGIALAIRRVSAGSVPPGATARSGSCATTVSRFSAPASVGQREADAPDGHEALAGVDGLEIRVEDEELHARLERPAAERGGNELERHREQRPTREVAEGLVLAV